MNPEIRKTLVCSTSHVSRNVMMRLDEDIKSTQVFEHVIHSCVPYGWLIRYWPPKSSEDRTAAWRTIPRCLKEVIERAEALGCSMVLFDADAYELEGVRTYEW